METKASYRPTIFSLRHFFSYTKDPHYKTPAQNNFVSNSSYLIYSYFFCLVFVMIAGILILLLDNFLVKQLGIASIYKQIRATNQGVKDYFGHYSLAIMVLAVPLIEETIFRLALNLKKISLSIAIALLCFRLLGNSFIRIDYQAITYWLSAAGSIGVLFALYYFIPQDYLKKIGSKFFKNIYYFSAISFGLVHILNIKPFRPELILLYPLFVLPQIIMGFFFGNIRMQRGFVWSVALHGLLNITSFFLR